MGTSLKEVLREKASQYAAQAETNKEIIGEWQLAVDKLYQQLEEWLKAIDPDGIIKHDISQTEVTEPDLGRYRISRLNLQAFGKWVGLIPKARKTIKKASPPQKGAP